MTTTCTSTSDRRQRLRQAAASSNRYLNAVIHECGGGDAIRVGGKARNTYAVVADTNNIAIRGAMAHVVQTLEDVRQTREAYTDEELEKLTLLEMHEARALQRHKPQGHAEIIRAIAREIQILQEWGDLDDVRADLSF